MYLNELDQFTKHKLREKYYLRYMDDFLVLGTDKAELRRVRDKIRDFLKSELDLSFNLGTVPKNWVLGTRIQSGLQGEKLNLSKKSTRKN